MPTTLSHMHQISQKGTLLKIVTNLLQPAVALNQNSSLDLSNSATYIQNHKVNSADQIENSESNEWPINRKQMEQMYFSK